MKLLLSCYECSPVRGSEGGVGWNWVREARRLGHDVWALASPTYEEEIRQGCSGDELAAGVNWVFPRSRFWRLKAGQRPKAERWYNLLWQVAALRTARELHRSVHFDAVQHVTWGGIRYPSFLGRLDAPFILGPVGGGETSPAGLRDVFSLRNRITERLRDLSNATVHFNPLLRGMLDEAAIIVVRTSETRDLLTGALRNKTQVHTGMGVPPEQIGHPREFGLDPPRLLFVGRLIYWKGAHLALAALAAVHETMPGVRLTIVGRGPEEQVLRAEARRRGLADTTTFISSWMPHQADVFKLYREHDLFVFPSLHDSGGTVVLEALCRGLPVVCLDLGGPKEFVTGACGVVVGTSGLTTESTANALAAAISDLLSDPERLRALSAGALARASEFSWPIQIAHFYHMISPYLGRVCRPGQQQD
jgi:glycosyltransferase involved in cell wall biosynthesis